MGNSAMTEYATPFTMLHAVSLLGHKSRLEKFERAIRKIVKPEDYVVDIGTGTGVLAMMAARAGAKRVTALDISKESLQYASHAARMNGLDEAIEFRHCHFRDYTPDERADVVLCEMLSSMMLIEQQIPAAAHANKVILKPRGLMLPSSVDVYAVPVECSSIWERFSLSDMEFQRIPQTASKDQTRDLADLQLMVYFDLSTVGSDTSVDSTLSFEVLREGTVHGLLGMFEATLLPEIRLTMEDGWRELFIPLEQPLEVQEGDVVTLSISYTPGVYDSLKLRIET